MVMVCRIDPAPDIVLSGRSSGGMISRIGWPRFPLE
jgi:hypothetical protein